MTLLDRIQRRLNESIPKDMRTSKEYYKSYLADDKIRSINEKLVETVLSLKPKTVLEFGAGVGKNLKLLSEKDPNIKLLGIDVSRTNIKNAVIPCLILGDEKMLNQNMLGRFDVIFTCSVLDHIKEIDDIIIQMKRLADKIILMETNSYDTNYYYKHDYELYGFIRSDYSYKSTNGGDNAIYEQWIKV